MTLLEIRRLELRRGDREILRGVEFSVAAGECVALMGLSGGGKTTVLRCIALLEHFDEGEIEVAGTVIRGGTRPSGTATKAIREHAGMVFQHHSLFEHLSALENVMLAPRHVAGLTPGEAAARAIELLETLGVEHRRDALPRELSGGEAQRVAIARAMAMNPPLLLMDEPTASLDRARRFELARILRTLREGGRTLLLTTHDDEFALEVAQRAVVLAEGSVVEEGPVDRVLKDPQHPATRAFLRIERDRHVQPISGRTGPPS